MNITRFIKIRFYKPSSDTNKKVKNIKVIVRMSCFDVIICVLRTNFSQVKDLDIVEILIEA